MRPDMSICHYRCPLSTRGDEQPRFFYSVSQSDLPDVVSRESLPDIVELQRVAALFQRGDSTSSLPPPAQNENPDSSPEISPRCQY